MLKWKLGIDLLLTRGGVWCIPVYIIIIYIGLLCGTGDWVLDPSPGSALHGVSISMILSWVETTLNTIRYTIIRLSVSFTLNTLVTAVY